MKKLFLLSIIGLSLGFMNSCSTDFNVVAPYKEVIVINGLLNPLDSVHYIHVGKAFLGEGNVYQMAQQADSVNYADILEVKMERIFNRVVQETFFLDRTTEIAKDSGAFAYPYQVLYKTTHPILQDGSEYKILVKNLQTGVTASSSTKILKDVNVTSPNPLNHDTINWASYPLQPTIINFDPSANSYLHDLIIRVHYREIDQNNVSTDKSFDWNFGDQTPGDNPVKFRFFVNEFLEKVGQNIPIRSGYTIRLDNLSNGRFPIELIVIEASEDLVTYYKLQTKTGGIVLDKPTFTTIDNGLGLFTSRIMHSEFLFPNATMQAAFDTSRYTRNLNIQF